MRALTAARLVPLAWFAVLIAGCGPEEPVDLGGAPRARGSAARNSRRTQARALSAAPAGIFYVTRGGRYTNLVYSLEQERLLGSDNRTPAEIRAEVNTDATNPDAWFALAKCYWDRHVDVAEALACFAQASKLVPDAMLPRMYIAEAYAAQGRCAESQEAFRQAYKLAQTPEEQERWCQSVQYVIGLRERGLDTDWAVDVLQDAASECSSACALLAELATNEGRVDDAVRWIEAGIALAGTNVAARAEMVERLSDLRGRYPGNAVLAARWDGMLDRAGQSEYDRLLLEAQHVDFLDRSVLLPDLCRCAAELSTNVEQRFDALRRLAEHYAYAAPDPGALNSVIDEMRGDEELTTRMALRCAGWLRNVGAYDDATTLLNDVRDTITDTGDYVRVSLSLADRGNDLDVTLLDELVARFPSNVDVLVDVANLYRRKQWYDQAAELRLAALAYMDDPVQRAAQAGRLLDEYLDVEDIDGASEVLDRYAAELTNRPQASVTIARLQLARGATNEAYRFLSERLQSADIPWVRRGCAEALLTTRWPDVATRRQAAALVWEIAAALPRDFRRDERAELFDDLAAAYVTLEMPEQALAACREAFMSGKAPDSFSRVCTRVGDPERLRTFITEVMNAGVTQQSFYAAAARTCMELDLPDVAAELYYQAWKRARTPNERLDCATTVLTTAHDALGDVRTEELLASLEQDILSGGQEGWRMWRLGEVFRRVGQDDRFEALAEQMIGTATGNQRLQAIQQLGWWYFGHGDTASVRRLLSEHFEGRELSPAEALAAARAYGGLQDREAQKKLLASLEDHFTNSAAIRQRGGEYLYMLANVGDAEQARALGMAWLNDPELPAQAKLNMLNFFQYQGNAREALEAIENSFAATPGGPGSWASAQILEAYARLGDRDNVRRMADHILADGNVPQWMLSNLTRTFSRMNMTADAVVFCERLQELWSDNADMQTELLRRQARLYLDMGDTEKARACAQELSAMDPGSYEAQSLQARLDVADNNPAQAVQGYIDALRATHEDRQRQRLVENITRLMRNHELDLDVRSLVDSLLVDQRSVGTLMTSAALVAADGDLRYAEQLRDQALAAATVDSQRAEILQQWVDAARRSGDSTLHLDALRAYLPWADTRRKANVVQQITDSLYNAGEYNEVVREADQLLKALEGTPYNQWAQHAVHRALARSYAAVGDVRAAWTATQELKEGANPDWHNFLQIARELGHEQEAVAELESVARRDDGTLNTERALLLAENYDDVGRSDDQRELTEELAGQLSSLNEQQRMRVASLLNGMNDHERAVAILTDIAEQGAEWQRREATERLFNIWKEQGALDEARAWVAARDENATTLALLAEICDAQDAPGEAAAYYQRALGALGAGEEWRRRQLQGRLAAAAAESGNDKLLAEAVDDVLQADAARVPQAQFQAAEMYRAARKYDDALDHYERAIRLADTTQEEVQFKSRYARCLEQAEKYEDAAGVYNELLKEDSVPWQQRMNYHRQMARAYERAELPNKAISVQKDLARACESYLRQHAYGQLAMSTRFVLADTLEETGNPHDAKRVLQRIVDDFQGTSDAKRAADRLARLGP